MAKRKVKFDAASNNNKTPTESLPDEFSREFTDVEASKVAERARIANRIEDEGKR